MKPSDRIDSLLPNALEAAGDLDGGSFTWRGMLFEWEASSKRWSHTEADGITWWVMRSQMFWARIYAETGQEVATIGRERYIAHAGRGGDGAECATRGEALEAALQYALRFHHAQIAALRKVCFFPEQDSP